MLWRAENDYRPIRLDSKSHGYDGYLDPFGVLKLESRPWLYNLDSTLVAGHLDFSDYTA